MSIETMKRRLVRLNQTKKDYRHGLADRLAAARAKRMAQRAERVRMGLPADLTTEERIADLTTKQAEWSKDGAGQVYIGGSNLGERLFSAHQRMLKRLIDSSYPICLNEIPALH